MILLILVLSAINSLKDLKNKLPYCTYSWWFEQLKAVKKYLKIKIKDFRCHSLNELL